MTVAKKSGPTAPDNKTPAPARSEKALAVPSPARFESRPPYLRTTAVRIEANMPAIRIIATMVAPVIEGNYSPPPPSVTPKTAMTSSAMNCGGPVASIVLARTRGSRIQIGTMFSNPWQWLWPLAFPRCQTPSGNALVRATPSPLESSRLPNLPPKFR